MRKKLNGYASRFEGTFAKALQEAGVSYSYEPLELEIWLDQTRAYKCGECGSDDIVRLGMYLPDFVLPNGAILETKGKLDATGRKKMLAVHQQWPEHPVTMVFMRNNYLTKSHHGTYTSWCDKQKIKWFVAGDIAKSDAKFKELLEWLKRFK